MVELTVLAVMKAKAGREDDLGDRLMALVAPTRREAACIRYVLHRSTEDRSRFMLYETWKSRAGLDQHFEMPYLRAFLADIDSLVEGELTIDFYELIER
jgi:quinol monooxygenase YgiN